jgi:hypothetical protein
VTGLAIKLGLVCIGLGFLVFVFMKIRQAGRDAEQAKQLANTVHSVEIAHEVAARVDAADPAERERLSRKWTADS